MRFGWVLAACLLACGGRAPVPLPPVVVAGPDFLHDEERVLRLLASADGRFAVRAGIVSDESELRSAGVKAILSEDTTTVMEGGRADLFSFDARARAIDDASKISAQYNEKDPKNGLEIERLVRTVEEERERLSQERELPLGAASLFVGLAQTWPVNAAPAEAEQHDARLAKRLDQVSAALASITPEGRDELEASLDPIEAKLSPPYTKSQVALVRLRVKLGETPLAPGGQSHPANVDATLEPRLRALLERLRKTIGSMAKNAPPPGPTPPCKLTGSSNGALGRMLAPPERQRICVIVSMLTKGPLDPLAAISLHDDVVIALWAIRAATMPMSAALVEPRPIAETSPHQEAEWARRAALHPRLAIDTALAIEWLLTDPQKNATAWDALGDAPVDLAIRELSAR